MGLNGKKHLGIVFGLMGAFVLAACGGMSSHPKAPKEASSVATDADYVIGPGDNLNVFVWRNPDLSATVPVRPDGRISIPLVKEVMAAGKSPQILGNEIQTDLAKFVQNPNVTVIVTNFQGPYASQIRIVGEAASPSAIPYRRGMTVLDAIIEVGGLTDQASGNRAVIVRSNGGKESNYSVRLDDLIRNGDVGANVDLTPGDIIIIPEKRF